MEIDPILVADIPLNLSINDLDFYIQDGELYFVASCDDRGLYFIKFDFLNPQNSKTIKSIVI